MNSLPQNNNNVERYVQISLAITAALGTLLLGLGQESVFLPSLAILAAVTSVVLTDILGTFRLNRNLANLGALLAVIYTVVVMILGSVLDRQDSQTSLIRVANLLVYLQVILQFQQKILRIYWSLSVLSLLQVVVASALNLSVSFGPLLAIYMCSALASLSLLFVFRETMPFHEDELPDAPAPGPPRRWPLSGRSVRWSAVGGEELARPLLGMPIARHIFGMGMVTLIVTLLIFFGVPRYDRNAWRAAGSRGTSVTGFSDEVSLNEMGRILQSDEEVLRATFIHPSDNRPFRVTGDVYLRGATLTKYSHGNWVSGSQPGWEGQNLSVDRSLNGRVIQDISLDIPLRPSMAGRHSVLFSTYPVYQHNQRQDFQLEEDAQRRQLLVDNTSLPNVVPKLRYIVRSGAFRGKRMAYITPESKFVDTRRMRVLQLDEIASLPQLRALAQQVVDEANATTPLEKAKAIELHFLFPNRYDYDLDPDVERTSGMDPVEDFISNHRTGHCEYFASAAVLMLRSQNIPARMVVGYKGGEWNSVGSYYQFRQLHAHAWVEAYLAPGEESTNLMPDGQAGVPYRGSWIRLDPTPADYDLEAAVDEGSVLAQIYDMVDYVQILWDDYVLGLNAQKQAEAIYEPIAHSVNRITAAFRGWFTVSNIAILSACCLAIACTSYFFLVYRKEQNIGGAGAGVAGTLGSSFNWFSKFLRREDAHDAAGGQTHVEFYRRLERLLSGMELNRTAGQTQREYAEAAGGALADAPNLQSVAGVPRRVASAFYQVRFGGRALDSSQTQAVEQSLNDLETALTAHLSQKKQAS